MRITDKGLDILSLAREPEYNEDLDSYLIYEWKGIQYFASLVEPENLKENQVFITVSEDQLISISREDTFASKISSIKDYESLINKNSKEQSKPNTPPSFNAQIPPKTLDEPNQKPKTPFSSEPSLPLTTNKINKKSTTTSNLSILSQITAEYEDALLLTLNKEDQSLLLEDFVGSNKPRENFKISLKNQSPFKIVFNTKQPFHGVYAETAIFNQSLNQCGINPQNLWVSAYPLIKNDEIIGMLLGLSNNRTYSLKELEIFERIKSFATDILNKDTDNNEKKAAA